MKKDAEELAKQISEDAKTRIELEERLNRSKQMMNRIKALAASEEAIKKVRVACNRLHNGRKEAKDDFMEVPLRFNGESRLFLLRAQVDYLAKATKKTANMLKNTANLAKKVPKLPVISLCASDGWLFETKRRKTRKPEKSRKCF